MNEREALQFVMEEIKEQRRADHEMYLDMRKQTTAMYERFLDRLRELDERDFEREVKVEPPMVPKQITTTKPVSTISAIEGIFKSLPPAPSAHMTPSEMRVDRIEETPPPAPPARTGKHLVSDEVIVPAVEEYLKSIKTWVGSHYIKVSMERKFGVEWSNFSNVMQRVIELSPYIEVDKTSMRRHKYRYKEI